MVVLQVVLLLCWATVMLCYCPAVAITKLLGFSRQVAHCRLNVLLSCCAVLCWATVMLGYCLARLLGYCHAAVLRVQSWPIMKWAMIVW